VDGVDASRSPYIEGFRIAPSGRIGGFVVGPFESPLKNCSERHLSGVSGGLLSIAKYLKKRLLGGPTKAHMTPKCVRVLLIDSSPSDQFLEGDALEQALEAGSTLTTVSSGDEAVAYMIGEGKFADREKFPFPTLIITDLKMEQGDGFDVLQFLAHNPAWSVVPRIVFTGSDYHDDVRTAYSLGASAYHVKPQGTEELRKQMRAIIEYWASSESPPVDKNGRQTSTGVKNRVSTRYPKPLAGDQMERP
jgi:CheY-like chemotaxis protein